ncbi:GTP-binding protein [Oribacterium sp. C9]|uniref:GTP-binding protein n=1 Tax=Oribacterium sp. C9 TaxID=1943579 RepID=UPI0011159775|nr:GTP-binding protein [Oribacterium sp. C9]
MKILVVSGFLGAGKTTFIKELIRRTGTAPVILENEYGNNSIDAGELRSTDSGEKKLEVLEFMEGCVCCTMKDSFINSVMTVFSGLSPEYLIIEPTGVGQLSNILNNLKPILHDPVTLLKPIVVLAPRSYKQNMMEFEALYRDQIAYAKTVVFSKCENEDPEVLKETEAAIRSINKDAEILCRHYSGQDDEWWRSVMALPSETISVDETASESTEFSQVTLNNSGMENPAQLIQLLEDCLRGQFGQVVRAKGTIPVGAETLRFDLADGLYSISGSPEKANQCVFIGRDLDRIGLSLRTGSLFDGRDLSISRKIIKPDRKPKMSMRASG